MAHLDKKSIQDAMVYILENQIALNWYVHKWGAALTFGYTHLSMGFASADWLDGNTM